MTKAAYIQGLLGIAFALALGTLLLACAAPVRAFAADSVSFDMPVYQTIEGLPADESYTVTYTLEPLDPSYPMPTDDASYQFAIADNDVFVAPTIEYRAVRIYEYRLTVTTAASEQPDIALDTTYYKIRNNVVRFDQPGGLEMQTVYENSNGYKDESLAFAHTYSPSKPPEPPVDPHDPDDPADPLDPHDLGASGGQGGGSNVFGTGFPITGDDVLELALLFSLVALLSLFFIIVGRKLRRRKDESEGGVT